jgi:hypothetical protein
LSADNLVWGNLDLDADGSLAFLAGSSSLYVDSLDLTAGLGAFADICDGSIFYENDSANSGLLAGGRQGTYTNSCGGSLIPFLGADIGSSGVGSGGTTSTPEPPTWLLLSIALGCLSIGTWIRRFRRYCAA